MSARLSDVIAILDTAYPPALAQAWDSVGLVCGDPDEQIDSITIAVDATAAVVEGADSVTIRRTQTLPGRRERETYVSETSAPTASLNDVGDIYLAAHATADVQITHDLTDGDDSPLPWVHYRPGDRVLTLGAGTTPVRRRWRRTLRTPGAKSPSGSRRGR